MKVCTRCNEEKESSDFYKHVRTKDGLAAYCIECDKLAKREYYQRNKEKTLSDVAKWQSDNLDKVRGYKRDWKKKNPDLITVYKHRRRSRESAGNFTAEEWLSLCEYYGSICLRCREIKSLSVDHVIPLCDGGLNTIDNIQPLCVDCNCKKGRKHTDYREF